MVNLYRTPLYVFLLLGLFCLASCQSLTRLHHKKSKHGGTRVITYYYSYGNIVYLLSIDDKVGQEGIS